MQNTIQYVDVKSLARKLGISLDLAHKFIQPMLFSVGYTWQSGRTTVAYPEANFLFLENNKITYGKETDMIPENNYIECILGFCPAKLIRSCTGNCDSGARISG